MVLSASLPTLGEGALKPREDMKALGTIAENQMLQPASAFFKTFAINCSRVQLSVDMFLFGTQFMDIATQGTGSIEHSFLLTFPVGSSRFTGGSLYYYPGFNAAKTEDAVKFASELTHFVSRSMGLEAVLRVRCTKGIRADAFHGNFFVRSSDLLALPTVSPDNAYALQLTVEENLAVSVACFQTALLYTTNHAERRIRIITMALPVTADMGEIYRSIDQKALTCLLAKMAIERALTSKLEDARDALVNKCVDILGVFKSNFSSSGHNAQLLAPDNLKLLPLMVLSILKNVRPTLKDFFGLYSVSVHSEADRKHPPTCEPMP